MITTGCGFALVWVSLRRRRPPAPPADAWPDQFGPVYPDVYAARRRTRLGAVVRALGAAVGLALMVGPWIVVGKWLGELAGLTRGLGRVLRVKHREQLAERALGDGWAGDAISLGAALAPAQRTVLGEWWLRAAQMEHASVAAFSQLALDLTAVGAPARLLEATHRAALDEIHHARASFAIVHALTGERQSAGPIQALAAARTTSVDLRRLAIESLLDGCVAEGIAADVAARGCADAEEPAIRAALAMIARDEVRHAELAWDILAWCVETGGEPIRAAVQARVEGVDRAFGRDLGRDLARAIPGGPSGSASTLARFGVVAQDHVRELALARIAGVQDRARRLLARGGAGPAHRAAA
ncbi:MAG TPA: ferritin-like domain-containing protein [Kofleriaceae bacterium]|nr:ferritin-like domain-containing protein [Kofleriaceae bacterium]